MIIDTEFFQANHQYIWFSSRCLHFEASKHRNNNVIDYQFRRCNIASYN